MKTTISLALIRAVHAEPYLAYQLARLATALETADRLLGEGRALEAQGYVQTAAAIVELTLEANPGLVTNLTPG